MRSAPRNLLSSSATLVAEDGGMLGPVAILDISTGGARLAVPADRTLPSRFGIILPGQQQRLCEVRWRLTHALGVRFVDRAPTRPISTLSRIQELEAAIARLERENAVLAQELSLHRAFQFEAPCPGASDPRAETRSRATPVLPARAGAPQPLESRRTPPAKEPRLAPSARFLGTLRARAAGA
jgi:hypothetical protein